MSTATLVEPHRVTTQFSLRCLRCQYRDMHTLFTQLVQLWLLIILCVRTKGTRVCAHNLIQTSLSLATVSLFILITLDKHSFRTERERERVLYCICWCCIWTNNCSPQPCFLLSLRSEIEHERTSARSSTINRSRRWSFRNLLHGKAWLRCESVSLIVLFTLLYLPVMRLN